MKRVLSLALAFLLLFGLAGCAAREGAPEYTS